jgi:hypothetical protein
MRRFGRIGEDCTPPLGGSLAAGLTFANRLASLEELSGDARV